MAEWKEYTGSVEQIEDYTLIVEDDKQMTEEIDNKNVELIMMVSIR